MVLNLIREVFHFTRETARQNWPRYYVTTSKHQTDISTKGVLYPCFYNKNNDSTRLYDSQLYVPSSYVIPTFNTKSYK